MRKTFACESHAHVCRPDCVWVQYHRILIQTLFGVVAWFGTPMLPLPRPPECRGCQADYNKNDYQTIANHTHVPTLKSVSARLIRRKLKRNRAMEAALWPPAQKPRRRRNCKHKRKRQPAAGRMSQPVKKVRRKGGGGRWRAFVSSRCKHLAKAILPELAEEFKHLPEKNSRSLLELVPPRRWCIDAMGMRLELRTALLRECLFAQQFGTVLWTC